MRMEYVKNLVPDRDALDKYYGTYISGKAKDLILEAFDGTCLYIQQNITAEFKGNAKDYYPGHGLFMVPRVGSLYYVLDNHLSGNSAHRRITQAGDIKWKFGFVCSNYYCHYKYRSSNS